LANDQGPTTSKRLYSVSSFEDAVIFVHDVERCVAKLDRLSQTLIARVILQAYSHEEAGILMGCCRRTLERNLPEALDRLSENFSRSGNSGGGGGSVRE
jgi:DNA-directed RNA polymerase specialized sigma24 family protein